MGAGGFTIPGQSGHEELTLELAARWGADVIRDSDGTELSADILESGLGICSTICLIREDNEWARANPDKLQQNFLMSDPVAATDTALRVDLLAGYSRDQFRVSQGDGLEFWQVFNRTEGVELPRESWALVDADAVVISQTTAGHVYTVNFLATRLWEEISMYNHVTNAWGDRERLMAVEPRYPEVADHLLEWLDRWCRANPATTIVRFTSLFYNFAWFWGSDPDLPHRYSDWASYDFTVTPVALRQFTTQTGLEITSEDFVNGGRYTSAHNPPSPVYLRWMEFVGEYVRDLGSRCVELVHSHGKQAVVFYDDSWIGMEPYSGHFQEFGFDGIIKAVFSAYEARLCAGVPTESHELRLHPYLFPVDLEGKPTFSPGGDPTSDLWTFWRQVRRGLLRAKIDRIGLGGYLSLVEPFPDLQDAVARIADEHRLIRSLHEQSAPDFEPVRVGVLTSWGALRSWSSSGHLHEHPTLTMTHVVDALAGSGYDVSFLSLDQVVEAGVPEGISVLINAGTAGSAWSGGDIWRNPALTAAVREWVANGGGFIGIQEPSAVAYGLGTFQLADVMGVDRDLGDRLNLGQRRIHLIPDHELLATGASAPIDAVHGVFLTRAGVEVAAVRDGCPTATLSAYGKGRAIYLAGLAGGGSQRRLLENAIQLAARQRRRLPWAHHPDVDVVRFAGAQLLMIANSSNQSIQTVLERDGVKQEIRLEPSGIMSCQILPDVAMSTVVPSGSLEVR